MDKKTMSIIGILVIAVVAVAAIAVFMVPHDQKEGVTDYAGNVIELTKDPTRIVCTDVVGAEIVSDLGYNKAIVGVSSYASVFDVSSDIVGIDLDLDYPGNLVADIESGKVAIVGSYYNWTADAVAACEPDIVIISKEQISSDTSKMTQLQTLGITVIVLNNEYGFQDSLDNYSLLGKILGKQSMTKKITDAMTSAFEKIKEVAAKSDLAGKKYAYICDSGSYGFYIYKNHMIITLLNSVGFVNSMPVNATTKIQFQEELAKANPDFIILDDMSMGLDWATVVAGWKADPVLGEVDCIKNDMFWCLEYKPFQACGYNTVHLINGAALIAAMINPEDTGVEVPNIVTSKDWENYIQWLDEY
ncbi:MAG: ABC transporter substrate-binding protein [Thermoplasmata archaeon]|jgi:ABC-type Fe3+-hydroxamate transport system substrate-binding protein|nr:ABC transporter substrate-binding protein [Thermoplasmata archaeon]